ASVVYEDCHLLWKQKKGTEDPSPEGYLPRNPRKQTEYAVPKCRDDKTRALTEGLWLDWQVFSGRTLALPRKFQNFMNHRFSIQTLQENSGKTPSTREANKNQFPLYIGSIRQRNENSCSV
ncbi:MAG: hypothetical protein LBS30_06135, partial [Planctomycetota bacterium]|nr:hypothetical protein [Planctomycetota bacterium]